MSLNETLDSITASLKATSKSADVLIDLIDSYDSDLPKLVSGLKDEIKEGGGVSLVALKNESLLGYLNSLATIIGSRLYDEDNVREEAVKSSVIHRLTLDKGVKPLERKLDYQLEKLMNSYRRKEKEVEEKGKEESGEESGEGSESESEEEGLNFKPNASALLKSGKEESSTYRPPRISAALPPSEQRAPRQRNLQSMDEYLQEVADAPTAEKSIGATIMKGGREVRSQRQIDKDARMTQYEEDNFVRLPTSKAKESKQAREKRMQNEFFGEDWSMFENKRDVNVKKRKKQSSWDRAKRRMQ